MNRRKSGFVKRVAFSVALGFAALYAANVQASITETTTITPGEYTDGDMYSGSAQMYEGLWNTFGIGSASPSATSNGHSYAAVVDGYAWFLDAFGMPYLAYQTSWIAFSGFTSDPGASWLVSVAGRSMAGQAYTYQSAYGSAVWGMPTGVSFGFSYGTPLAISITHQ